MGLSKKAQPDWPAGMAGGLAFHSGLTLPVYLDLDPEATEIHLGTWEGPLGRMLSG